MKHISILVPRGHFSMVNLEGTHQMLSFVNEFLGQQGKEPIFKIQLVGLTSPTTQTNGLFTVNPDALIADIQQTDLIILPALHGDLKANLELNKGLDKWIIERYKEGAEIVSLCIGSFFLASTGILNGKECDTHWRSAGQFRAMFPEVTLLDDKIITESEGIYTSGGAYSFTNLIIYLIEKYAGREIAIVAAKTFMIDIERNSQSPFIMFVGQKEHNDKEILHAQDYIENNFKEKLTVDELADKLNVGRRTFERRFKKATCNTVIEYIQRVKIEAAKKQLETGRKTVAEVMFEVGYTDTKAFRDVFKKISGMSPVDYRNRYNKAAAVL